MGGDGKRAPEDDAERVRELRGGVVHRVAAAPRDEPVRAHENRAPGADLPFRAEAVPALPEQSARNSTTVR